MWKSLTLLLVGITQQASLWAADPQPGLDAQLVELIRQHDLRGAPSSEPFPSPGSPLVQLGRDLFFSTQLSGDGDVACVSCHHPWLGGGDALSLSVGTGAEDPELLGPGRKHDFNGSGSHDPRADGLPNVPRNSPTTFNTVFFKEFLFHDGRVSFIKRGDPASGIFTPDSRFAQSDPRARHNLLAAQAAFPVTSAQEMRGFSFLPAQDNDYLRATLEQRFASEVWRERFRLAFDDAFGVTFEKIALATAAYAESQVFLDTPWRSYVEGDQDALTAAQKRGAWLFFASTEAGGAACASCHSGDFFTDESFHVLAIPQIGRGKDKRYNDFGRYRVTRVERDRYAFRTPSLLNVAVTAPYGHSGAYDSLEEVIAHHLNPGRAIASYDFTLSRLSQFEPVSESRAAWYRKNTEAALQRVQVDPLSLDARQISDLVAFMHALTDPCVTSRECLKPWVPQDLDEPTLLQPKFSQEEGFLNAH